ncbi:MAG: hypothetical protein P8X63_13405 [Desulfuromonadaceae bacterium]
MMLFQPTAVGEQAAERSVMTAVGINAVYGMLVLAALAPLMQSMFTAGLIASITLLFGPLLGFFVSSLYPRVEMTVGRWLGGDAPLDELYRLFAWSFLPAGLGLPLIALLFSLDGRTSTGMQWILSLPPLILFGCGIRNYCTNIIAAQRFTPVRGLTCLLITFILFVVLMTAGVGFVAILFRLGAGESLAAILFCQP